MDHLPFRVSTLRGDQKIDFNAYIKLNEKFILYIREGDSFEGARIQRLKEKKLKVMYLKPDEEKKYLGYLERNIEIAYDKNSTKSIENRCEIIQGAQQANAEEILENANNVMAYNNAKNGAGKFVQFLMTENKAFQSLISIDNVDKNMAHHGVAVATVATMLAKEMGMTDPKDLQMLVMGGLLHDYQHHQSKLNVSRPISEMTPAELKEYKEHPRLAAELLKEKKHFDLPVISIIHQHEEHINGSGFPQGLMEKKIHPLALLVGMANSFDRLVTFEGVAKNAAAKKMMIDKMGKYPLDLLQKLTKVSSQL